jgi:pyruvate/oxaloacetate carboxyltransferase
MRAEVLIVIGDLDAALAEIERLAAVNAGFDVGDLQWPVFDPVRDHPRFQQVIARLRGSPAEARR